jgi:ankyrin repeat protein
MFPKLVPTSSIKSGEKKSAMLTDEMLRFNPLFGNLADKLSLPRQSDDASERSAARTTDSRQFGERFSTDFSRHGLGGSSHALDGSRHGLDGSRHLPLPKMPPRSASYSMMVRKASASARFLDDELSQMHAEKHRDMENLEVKRSGDSPPKQGAPGKGKNPFTFYITNRGPVDGPEYRDPKKVFEGIAALSLHAAQGQLSQLKSVIVADKEAVMSRDRDGDRYPLHWAAARGHMHCVQELRRAGADDAALDANGQTAAELAEAYGAMDVYYFLTYGPAEVDPKPMSGAMMHDALSLHCALNLPRELKRILDKKLGAHANPNRLDKDRDRRPIHWAAARGAIECCRLLLDAGANELCTDKDGRTAADLALVCNQRAAHKLLCDAMVAKQRPGTTELFGCRPATGEAPLDRELLDRFDAMIERFSSSTPLAETTSQRPGTAAKLVSGPPATGEPPLSREFLNRFDEKIERFSPNTPLAETTSRATGEGAVFDRLTSTSICHPYRSLSGMRTLAMHAAPTAQPSCGGVASTLSVETWLFNMHSTKNGGVEYDASSLVA